VNDEPPKFNKKEYHVEIPENLAKDSPLPNLDMTITDTDIVMSIFFFSNSQSPQKSEFNSHNVSVIGKQFRILASIR
jgi:hypothetical protein